MPAATVAMSARLEPVIPALLHLYVEEEQPCRSFQGVVEPQHLPKPGDSRMNAGIPRWF